MNPKNGGCGVGFVGNVLDKEVRWCLSRESTLHSKKLR